MAKLYMNPKNRPNDLSRVNWQQARVLEMQKEYADAFSTQAASYAEMREAYRTERRMWNTGGPEMAQTVELRVPFGTNGDTVPARLLRPVDQKGLPVLFFIHGGGFVEGDNDTHNLMQRKLAAYSGCAVIGIEYSLSPEVRYPRPVEECAEVVKYALANAETLGIDPERIGFAGDSGGANLSMATTVYLRDQGFDTSVIKANVLYYGAYGLSNSLSASLHGGSWDGMGEADLAFYWSLYLPEGCTDSRECPYFNLYVNDLSYGMPSCFLVGAELDPLCDDSKLMYEVLTGHGVACEYREYKGVLHAFMHYSKVMDDAEDALRRGAHFFARACGLDPRN